MKLGIAFIHGIGIFGNKNYKKEEILDCLKKIENKELKIVGIYGNDNVVFQKGDVHYATVGSMIEKCLEREFGRKFDVTTRSFNTIDRLIKKYESD